MINKQLQLAFPGEAMCINLLTALNLNGEVKRKICERKPNDFKEIEDIIASSPDSVLCHKCPNSEVYRMTKGKYPFQCSSCKRSLGERTKTFFMAGKLSLKQYFMIIFLKSVLNKKFNSEIWCEAVNITPKSVRYIVKKLDNVKNYKSNKQNGEKIKYLEHGKYIIETLEKYLSSHPNLAEIKRILNAEGLSFISYPGSKRSIMNNLLACLPNKINNYFEPFIGGGTMFFAMNILKQSGVIDIKKMYISDYSKNLIEVYEGLKENSDEVCMILKRYQADYNALKLPEERKSFFESIKTKYNGMDVGYEKTANFIFLTKTSYQGRFDFDSKGRLKASVDTKDFNFNEERVLSFGKALNTNDIFISRQSYEAIESMVQEGDFIYLDPPYFSYKSGMIDYGSRLTTEEGQREIRDFLLRMHKRGVLFMFSNYATPLLTKDLYSDASVFKIQTLTVQRRTKEAEIIVTNY